MKIAAIALALGTASTLASASVTFSGNDLKEYMREYAKVEAGQQGNEVAAGIGLGYVMGIADGIHAATTAGNNRLVCNPPRVTYGQQASITKKYLDNHPEHLHLPASFIVAAALNEAFPCAKK